MVVVRLIGYRRILNTSIDNSHMTKIFWFLVGNVNETRVIFLFCSFFHVVLFLLVARARVYSLFFFFLLLSSSCIFFSALLLCVMYSQNFQW